MRKIEKISEFTDMLSLPYEQKYFKLFDPLNWEMIINGIWNNIYDTKKRMARLQSLKHVVIKAPQQARFRIICLQKEATKTKLINVTGAMIFIETLGFEYDLYNNSPAYRLHVLNSEILNIAKRCLDYKIKLVNKLRELQKLWQTMVQVLLSYSINNASFANKYNNLINSFIALDFVNHSDAYTQIFSVIELVQNKNKSKRLIQKKHKISMEILKQFGLKFAVLKILKHKQLTKKLLLNVKIVYDKINEIEKYKTDYYKQNEKIYTAQKHKLFVMCSVLNMLWFKLRELLKKNEIIFQTKKMCYCFYEKLIYLDFTKDNDYQYILSKVVETSKNKEKYSTQIEFAQAFDVVIGFYIDECVNKKEILNATVDVLKQIEKIEKCKKKTNENINLINSDE